MATIVKRIAYSPIRSFLPGARYHNVRVGVLSSVLSKQTSKHYIFRHSLCTSSGVSTDPTPKVQSTTKKRDYNVGVLGAGRIASSVHIRNILKNRRLNLKWILDDSPAAVSSCKDLLNLHNTPFYTSDDRESLLSDESLDAVFVFTPTDTHADYICESLSRGKAVMTEKPCGETYADIKRCYDMAERVNKPLLTGFQRRFDRTFRDVFQSTRDKALGDLKFMRVTGRDSPRPSYEFLRNTDMGGCNIISDMAVHDIDMTVWLTSAERPISVYTMSHMHDPIMKEIGQPDSATLALKYGSGLMAIIDSDRYAPYGYDMRVEIFGAEGMALAENPRESASVIDVQNGGKLNRLYDSFPQRFEAAFEKEIDHFVDCLDGKDTPLIKKAECLLTMEIVEKGVESFKTGNVAYL
ncbi:uncharacterized protein LOC110462495 isoform X2 [Mizuhopecten yessoensis]|uniref:uncharacterized protein LOC110462495 isoform X1 n=1 Tax=Mizuhopecten yessoensis TaxID=6573 RepID=UPI000B45E7ED|nr:uncharacterized protein LOC110462495 isoform X1 [Mizuhopecten yessoensis]XP_021372136.1 uncharacterized protein LOC110462495 isoform X2 [Mizuhopecten yessoensis]